MLKDEYDNQVNYQSSTVDISGELNTAYQSPFHLYNRLRLLAESVIEAKEEDDD